MLIGGCPGGTAGGVKVTAIPALFSGLWSALRGRPVNRAFAVAVGWVTAYVGAVAAAWLVLVAVEPDQRPDRLLILAASAAGNVGLSHDPVSVSAAGTWTLSAAMLFGRVAPVLLLWIVAERMPDVDQPIG